MPNPHLDAVKQVQTKLADKKNTLSNSPLKAYGLERLTLINPSLASRVQSFLSDPSVPQSRKDAAISELSGKLTSVPERSGFDELSEQLLGRSNYSNDIHKLGESIGEIVGRYVNTDYQEKYDANEIGRLRDRGVNVDLSDAASLSAGSAADYDDQSGSQTDFAAATDNNPISSLANVIQSVLSNSLGFVSSLQGIIRNGLENDQISTSILQSDHDLIAQTVLNSGLFPFTAHDLNDGWTTDDGKHYDFHSFKDDKGKFLPYERLSLDQRSDLDYLARKHFLNNTDRGTFDMLFSHSGFSKSKLNRLYNRYYSYLESPEFTRRFYESKFGGLQPQFESQKIEQDAGFSAFDSLANGLVKSLSRSQYLMQTDSNLLASEQAKEMLNKGLPKEHVLQELRQLNRDKLDNKVMDDFRNYLLDVSEGFERVDGKRVKKKYDKWESITAKIGLIFLYLVRNGGISALNPLK